MDNWSLILSLLGSFGFGTLFPNIIDKILGYNLQKKKFLFEKLYLERAQIIKETYQKMVKMHRAFESLMTPLKLVGEPSKVEKMLKAADLANDFINYFDINRIFFDEGLEEKINGFDGRMRGAWNKFRYASTKELDGQNFDQWNEEWNEAWIEVREEIPKLKKEIEKKFREEIGMQSKNK